MDGDGSERYKQHRSGCTFEYIDQERNPGGVCFSHDSAMPTHPSRGAQPARRCSACIHLAFDAAQGAAYLQSDAHRYRQLAPCCGFSFVYGSTCGDAASFASAALPAYEYNVWLRELLAEVNRRRGEVGLPLWSEAHVHWHMFRHGSYIMSIVSGTSEADAGRLLMMEPETMSSYRAHVSRFTADLLKQNASSKAVVDAAEARHVMELARELQEHLDRDCGVYPRPALPMLNSALQSFLSAVGLRTAGLRRLGSLVRQIAVHSAAFSEHLPHWLVRPLLDVCYRGQAAGDGPLLGGDDDAEGGVEAACAACEEDGDAALRAVAETLRGAGTDAAVRAELLATGSATELGTAVRGALRSEWAAAAASL